MNGVPWVRAEWFDEAPVLIGEATRRWRLRPSAALGGLASRVTLCADADGRELVLKIAPPEMRPALEAAALRHWAGNGAPKLIDFAEDLGALLMERIVPGTTLRPGDDAADLALVAEDMLRLHAAPLPEPTAFPSHADYLGIWLERVRVSGEDGTAGMRLLPEAIAAASALDTTKRRSVLLHGDFIDKNLLLGASGYVATDPLPRIGDPCSDIGFFAAYHPPASGVAVRARALARLVHEDVERAARWSAIWAVGEATETWRADSDELQAWVSGPEARSLLVPHDS